MEYKKKIRQRICVFAIDIIIGAALIAVSVTGAVTNEIISFFGCALAVAGAVKLIQNLILIKNEEALHNQEIAEKDERNIMLMNKSKSAAFSVYLILAGISIIALYLTNNQFAGQIIAYSVCVLILTYFICYHVIKRRY